MWFGLSILIHFGLGGWGEVLGFLDVARGMEESCGGDKFGEGSGFKGSWLFPFWLNFFE